ncbi:DUF3316 domain-containing protein [Vibrio panuliri]|uniref:Acyl-CoA synthetase n=1 Tax=Vibrio panuliri TaxID=1381081 RepID=A0A1Q9HRP4_9VIBR|nr:DUF3316 domain-containing protein [Vibrio panuliri]KAB1457152.1 DUF3316 domain-containing protein [Vibrio panuliri]OLQ87643.1 acyl-CoA synthetase [Vibrio panuliri]OLQ93530.1 acyl-CoA synthetase [Vibrio panuliri]
MIKLAGLVSVVLFTSVAMAGGSGPYSKLIKSSTMAGNAYDSKAAALESGRMMIVDVNRMDSLELSRNVFWSTNDQVDLNSFELLNSQVQIEEIVTSEGAIAYQPVISVSYEYRARDRD